MTTRVSFCTTCRNRLHHLQETLPKNLKDNETYPEVEFIIVDYDDQTGMEEWAKKTLDLQIRTGRVVYVKVRGMGRFKRSHAKNIGHLMATGDIQVNVDADNFTGKDSATAIAKAYEEAGPRLLICVPDSLHHGPSLYGRVGLGKYFFKELRGYDETMEKWSLEDNDLCHRAIQLGGALRHVATEGCSAIEHSVEERASDTTVKYDPFSYQQQVRETLRHRRRTDPKGLLVNPKGWGQATVWKNFDNDTPISIGFGPGRLPEWKVELVGLKP